MIISEYSQRSPKSSKEVRSLSKTSICDVSGNSPDISQSQSCDEYKPKLAPSAFHSKNQRSRGRYIVIYKYSF